MSEREKEFVKRVKAHCDELLRLLERARRGYLDAVTEEDRERKKARKEALGDK